MCWRLWVQEVIEFHGQCFDFGPVAFEPKPLQRPGVPLQIGGDGPAAPRRAATAGAGWMPVNHALEGARPILAANFGDVARPDYGERYGDAGVCRLLARPWRRSSEALDGVRRFADEVIGPMGLTG